MASAFQKRGQILSYHSPNGVQQNFVSFMCFTCSKIRAVVDCTSVVLELQNLNNNVATRSNIFQVICQLLRVEWGSMESLKLDDGTLPFCPSCLKTITEVIILREKLFQIEAEIREKLKKLEFSVAECLETYECKMNKKTPNKGSCQYDELRSIFQKQVLEEYLNKELLQQKIMQMDKNRHPVISESLPSMVQFHFEKNVFSISDEKSSWEFKEIDFPAMMNDASTDTIDLYIATEDLVQFKREVEFISDEDDEMPPVLEAEGTCEIIPVMRCDDEDFTLIPIRHDTNCSDDSDYGSPSKKSRTDIIMSATSPRQKIERERETAVSFPIKKKVDRSLKPKLKNRRNASTSPFVKKSSRLEHTKARDIPGSSKCQKALSSDSEEEVEADDDNGSDWELEKGDSEVSDSKSSDSENDSPESDYDAKNEETKVIFEESADSVAELCKKHTFKPKHSLHPTSKHEEKERTFVKVVQEEATFTAKDKTVWTTMEPNHKRQTRAYEVLREKGGLVGKAKDSTLTPTEIFKLMFPPAIVETIVKHTNAYATYVFEVKPKKNKAGIVIKWKPLTLDEMYAYIGILLYFGTGKLRNTAYKEAWMMNEHYSIPLIIATMGIGRFRSIGSFLRFDDKVARMTTKESEAEDDVGSKVSYISEVLEPFVENMQKHLRPYDTLIVDEMLVRFHGSSKFRVYMKSKPGKFGMKLWAVCDVETGYVLKVDLYQGKIGDKVEREHGKKVVLNLVKKYFGSGRGVTMDSFFTSKSLGEELIKQKMSMLGTLNHNRMDVIPQFVNPKGREPLSSVFAFQGDFTMVSYVPKKNRAVLLLSTQHHAAEIDSLRPFKPKIILDYNMTKAGVDTADQMIANYSCQRTTGRWPVKIFQALLDIAALNAYVVYKMHKSSADFHRTTRRMFLRRLSEGLMHPLFSTRIQRMPMPSRYLDSVLEKVGYGRTEDETLESRITGALDTEKPKLLAKTSRCYFCPKRTNTRSRCTVCLKGICAKCRTKIYHCPSPKCAYIRAPPPPPRKDLQSCFRSP